MAEVRSSSHPDYSDDSNNIRGQYSGYRQQSGPTSVRLSLRDAIESCSKGLITPKALYEQLPTPIQNALDKLAEIEGLQSFDNLDQVEAGRLCETLLSVIPK